jgi:peroxiredoxin
MKRVLYSLVWLPSAWAQQPPDLLKMVHDAYSNLSAVHVVATRADTISLPNGAAAQNTADYELAEMGGGKYLARLKGGDTEAVAVCDGASTWKALPKQKQWMKLEAADESDADEEEIGEAQPGEPQPQDLHTQMENLLVRRYLNLAKYAPDAELGKEDAIKVGGAKIRCRVVRFEAAGALQELWIDEQRGFVLQHRQVSRRRVGNAIGQVEVVTKVKQLETNGRVEAGLFSFEPQRSWTQVDMLALPGEEKLLLTGRRAADFELKSVEGEHVELASLQGKVVVLDFWATWCGPCRQELPIVDQLRREFGDQVQFLGINDEDSGTVKGFLRKNGYGITVLMDSKRSVHRTYGVHSIPTLIVIDRDGVIRQHFIGGRDAPALRQAIDAVLKVPSGG